MVVEHEPGRLLAWRHEAERLDGRPAPRFATEMRFCVRLEPEDGATRVRLESRRQPAHAVNRYDLGTKASLTRAPFADRLKPSRGRVGTRGITRACACARDPLYWGAYSY
jgi:hypothetical protein